jgi:hypothetical protein
MTLRTNLTRIVRTTALLVLVSVGLLAQSDSGSTQSVPTANADKNAALAGAQAPMMLM